ncbi:MAG: hypothetical protein KDB09_07630 [Acidimicrobiales bacterium]|nr:hypothetical protein [Acidimicrobiales bacterium]
MEATEAPLLVAGSVAEMFGRGRCVRRLMVGAGLCLAALSLTGCATDVPSHDDLVQAFEDSGLSPDLSRCVTDALLKNLPDEDLIRLVERGKDTGPRDDPNRDDDPYDLTRAALTKCQEQDRATSTTTAASTTTATATTTTATSTSTTSGE